MITVYEVVVSHCNQNQIQFNQKDLAIVGKIVGYNFKNNWAQLIVKPTEGASVPGGFKYIRESGRLVVVNAYDSVLLEHIKKVIIDYFTINRKPKGVINNTGQKKERKRIPAGRVYKKK